MPQAISFGPFEKFDNGHNFGADPNAFLHLFCVQNLAPSSASGLRQIHERTHVDDLQFLVNHSASRWYKSVANASDVNQILSAIVAHYDRIDSVWTRQETADDKFLAAIDSQLRPGARALSRLIHAVLTLRYNTFE